MCLRDMRVRPADDTCVRDALNVCRRIRSSVASACHHDSLAHDVQAPWGQSNLQAKATLCLITEATLSSGCHEQRLCALAYLTAQW